MLSTAAILSCFLAISVAQRDDCTVNYNDSYTVLETDPPGKEILTIPSNLNVSWTVSINYQLLLGSPARALDSYLILERSSRNGDFVLKVNRTLDLEQIRDDYNIKLSLLELKLQCQQPLKLPQSSSVFLNVNPVNEFAPEFTSSRFNLTISESSFVGHTLIQLSKFASDHDVNPATNEIAGYSIEPFDDGTFKYDGRDFFHLTSVQQGTIALYRALDFEGIRDYGQEIMWLNVTVQDQAKQRSWASLRVTVLDDDDLSPEFYYSGCPPPSQHMPCLITYTIRILANTTGPVTDIHPAEIFAHDRDTIGNNVTYFLRDSSGLNTTGSLSSHLKLNSSTGHLTVIRPFVQLDFYQNILFVVAEELSVNRRTAQATLQLDVYSPTFDPALTTPNSNLSSPSTRRSHPSSSSGGSGSGSGGSGGSGSGDGGEDGKSDGEGGADAELIAIIGMGVLGLLVLILVVALFCMGLVLRKLRIARVGSDETLQPQSPYPTKIRTQDPRNSGKLGDGEDNENGEDEDASSETASRESEEASDQREATAVNIDQTELLSSLPNAGESANKLPPLKSPPSLSNGEVAEAVARGDIFDGTRQFEMGLNPEFFTQRGKTKVAHEPEQVVEEGHVEDVEPIIINGDA